LKVELAEIQIRNSEYSNQVRRTTTETQAHARRGERLQQIVEELAALKGPRKIFGR
jgi:hypothetical protein